MFRTSTAGKPRFRQRSRHDREAARVAGASAAATALRQFAVHRWQAQRHAVDAFGNLARYRQCARRHVAVRLRARHELRTLRRLRVDVPMYSSSAAIIITMSLAWWFRDPARRPTAANCLASARPWPTGPIICRRSSGSTVQEIHRDARLRRRPAFACMSQLFLRCSPVGSRPESLDERGRSSRAGAPTNARSRCATTFHASASPNGRRPHAAGHRQRCPWRRLQVIAPKDAAGAGRDAFGRAAGGDRRQRQVRQLQNALRRPWRNRSRFREECVSILRQRWNTSPGMPFMRRRRAVGGAAGGPAPSAA